MLRELTLKGVGPGELLVLGPVAPRLNLIAGDNGLGKTFFLETAWWALTRTWNETPAVPTHPNAAIGFQFDGEQKRIALSCPWSPDEQTWKRPAGRPPNPGLIMYARVDGSFSVWDPVRNYRLYTRSDGGKEEAPPAYRFNPREVMYGLKWVPSGGGAEQTLCLGLVDEWREWQRAGDPRFELLKRVLAELGPEGEPFIPGQLKRPYMEDVRMIPTISMGYQQDVPLTYAPAGVKRMCMLAYLLAWAISEHADAAQRLGKAVTHQVILLVDEPETHLHPRWQRTVLPSLIRSVQKGFPGVVPEIQVIAATHSPLVLASLEPIFDTEKDALWKLDLVDGVVKIEKDEWHRRGEVGDWLTSDVFDMETARNRPAELAIDAAEMVMADPGASIDDFKRVQKELSAVLPGADPYWIQWRSWAFSRGFLRKRQPA